MYNRYIPNGAAYTRIAEEDAPAAPPPGPAAPPDTAERTQKPETVEKKPSGLAGLLKHPKLEDLDTGDVLLLLILLFLFLEGDDLELIITLGLLLVLGLG